MAVPARGGGRGGAEEGEKVETGNSRGERVGPSSSSFPRKSGHRRVVPLTPPSNPFIPVFLKSSRDARKLIENAIDSSMMVRLRAETLIY